MNPTAHIRLSRKLTLTTYAALLVMLVINWRIDNSDQLALELLLIATLPLLAFLPWILKGSNHAHIGLGCVLLIYVTKAVLGLALQPGLAIILEALASLALFSSALYYVHAKHLLRNSQRDDAPESGP